MTSRRATLGVVAGGLAMTVALSLIPSPRGAGVPSTPATDDVVLERVSVGGAIPTRGAPATPELAAQQARELITQARRNGGDPRLLGRAQAVLAPWWTVAVPHPDVLLMRATLKQALHDFPGSLSDLDALTVARPDDAEAWLTRATVLTVLARYDEALSSCARLTTLPTERLACAAAPRALTGDLDGAVTSLDEAVSATRDDATRAWLLSLSGELEHWRGAEDVAERKLRQALTLAPDDSYSRGLVAQVLMELGRAKEVEALYASRTLNDSELLLVVLAASASNGTQLEALEAELAERIAANRQRGETLHRREESRYALQVEHDVTRALQLAVDDWAVQKEPDDALVLLEAAVAAKQPEAARAVVAWLERTKFPAAKWKRLAAQVRP